MPASSGTHPLRIILTALTHQVPGGFGQFAGQRLGRDDRAGFGRLAIKPAAAMVVVLFGKIGRFQKGPGQIAVAAFAIVIAFLLVVGHAPGIHRAAIAGKLPWCFEAADLAHLHGDGHAQDATHSGQA